MDQETLELEPGGFGRARYYISTPFWARAQFSPVRGRYTPRPLIIEQSGPPGAWPWTSPAGFRPTPARPWALAVRADLTVTFGLVKLGLALDSGDYVGELACVDISIRPWLWIADLGLNAGLLQEAGGGHAEPDRPAGGHKGTFGHLLVVGGSPGKSGAVCLAAMGGLKAGAGLVTAGLPAGLNQTAEIKLTAAMSQPLPETTEGGLAAAGLGVLLDIWRQRMQAVVLGPGLSIPWPKALNWPGSYGQARRALGGGRGRTERPGRSCGAIKLGPLHRNRWCSRPIPARRHAFWAVSVPDILADRAGAARALASLSRGRGGAQGRAHRHRRAGLGDMGEPHRQCPSGLRRQRATC